MISVDPGEDCFWGRWSAGWLTACGPWARFDVRPGDTAVIETQVIIPKFTKRPADIITLAHHAGSVAREFGWPKDINCVKWIKPHQWKGNIKKPTSARAWASYAIHRLVVEALQPGELAIYTVALSELPEGERHNLADALGIGLWELGRLPQPRTESPRRAARMQALNDTLKRQA